MKISFLSAAIFILISCSSSNKSSVSQPSEKSKLASFILVKSIPVSILSKDSVLGLALQGFMTDTLKESGYKFISDEERAAIQKKFFLDVFGTNDPEKILEIGEKVKQDNDYIIKQKGAESPIEQVVILFPSDSDENLIMVRRVNIPTSSKKREWLIPFEDSELVTSIAARIVDSVTARQNLKRFKLLFPAE